MLPQIMIIGLYLIIDVAVVIIGGRAVIMNQNNPLPKFDDGDGDENRSITFMKTRSIV